MIQTWVNSLGFIPNDNQQPPSCPTGVIATIRGRRIPASAGHHGGTKMPVFVQTVLLLIASNVFMTFAWYAHLKELNAKPWYIAAMISWGIALFEYLLQVPANRIGYTQLTLPQLKILQEVITLSVFVPFTIFYMRQSLLWDFLWAGLCLLGAVYFIFRNPTSPTP
jgi:uncharacterized protein (DUF486 family)